MSAAHEQDLGDPPDEDRRVRRTRAAITAAFDRLILERGYAALSPAEIAAAANVGRSTFYEHFRGLDDLLEHRLGPVLEPLASGCFQEAMPDAAASVTQHLWDNRRMARALLSGDANPLVLRTFAAQFTAALTARLRSPQAVVPAIEPELIGLAVAAGQLALLGAWLAGRSGRTPPQIAQALHAGGRASVMAWAGSLDGA